MISVIYCYLVKNKFYYRLILDFELSIIITQDRPSVGSENIEYTVEKNQKFTFTRNKSEDNDNLLIVIGCNKTSNYIDINLYDCKLEEERPLLMIIPDNSRCFMADMSEEGLVAKRIRLSSLVKGCIIRLANNFFLGVLDLKCGYRQILQLQDLNTMEIYSYINGGKKILIGSSKTHDLDIKAFYIGVSKVHCQIQYSYEAHEWILEDIDSANGTWIMLKNIEEYIKKQPSQPIIILDPQSVLAIGPQKLILNLS